MLYFSSLSTHSITVWPTFPHATALMPDSRNIAAVISTVVVFPFVPVSAIQLCSGLLKLYARSISFISGIFALSAL